MTNEKAISLLKAIRGMIEWDEPMEYSAAIDMAVEALTNAHDTNADTISRRSVLDLIRTFPSEEYNSKLLYQSVMQLPSAQPGHDKLWSELSKVYNMDIPREAREIIGDVMLSLDGGDVDE